MAGLEKIIKEIRDEAANQAKAIIEKAQAEAKRTLDEAASKQNAQSEKNREATAKQLERIEQSCQSAIDLARRRQTLQTKQELIDETLQKSLQTLYSLPDDEYFALLTKLAAKNAQEGEGLLHLNEKDLARMPKAFATGLNSNLPENAKLTVTKSTRNIDGGFVLQYDDIEENCSFSAIFNARRDEFSDLVRSVLF